MITVKLTALSVWGIPPDGRLLRTNRSLLYLSESYLLALFSECGVEELVDVGVHGPGLQDAPLQRHLHPRGVHAHRQSLCLFIKFDSFNESGAREE